MCLKKYYYGTGALAVTERNLGKRYLRKFKKIELKNIS